MEKKEGDGKKTIIVTRGGSRTREDVAKKNQDQHQWVKKNTTPQHNFDVCKEKETFKEVKHEILNKNIVTTSSTKPRYDVPVYDMPHMFDQANSNETSKKVSNMRKILGSCVKLLNDRNSLQVFQSLLEKCNYGEEMKLEHKTINQVPKKIRTSREFILNANIGYFNMGDIILDLRFEGNVLPKKTWESMGEPTLGFSLVQLKL
jgi:hypothetical protein